MGKPAGARDRRASTPHKAQDCIGRSYGRLNADYEILHALCRFFLESTGPSHETGHHGMLPFLVDMAGLFERFVAEWVKVHAPTDIFIVQAQASAAVTDATWLQFDVDIVLIDRETGRTWYVIDTKYKASGTVDQADVSQVVTYAKLMGATEALLVYPEPVVRPLDAMVGDVHVRTCTFSLAGDLEAAGRDFLASLPRDIRRVEVLRQLHSLSRTMA